MKENGIEYLITLLRQHMPLTEYNRKIFFENHINEIVLQLDAKVKDVKSDGLIECIVTFNESDSEQVELFCKLSLLESEKNKLLTISKGSIIKFSGNINYVNPSDYSWWYFIYMHNGRLIN